MSDSMPVSVPKKSRVFKVKTEIPVVAVDLVAPDLNTVSEPVATEPLATEPVATEPVPTEPVDFDTEVAPPEVVGKVVEMWRGIELEPVKTDMPSLESDKEEEEEEEEEKSDSEMPPLCTANCNDCDCSALKDNKGLTISAIIEKAIEDHLSPEESDADADADDADAENEDVSDFKNIRPRTISDSIKETLEEHLNPKEPPSRPDYTLIIVALTVAIGLWHLYVCVNTATNTINEF
jgi:hypothetical protein